MSEHKENNHREDGPTPAKKACTVGHVAGLDALTSAIFTQNPYPIWISDAEGTLIRINQACCDMLHIQAEEVIGKYNILQDNIVKEQGHLPQVKAVFEEGRTAEFTIEYENSRLDLLNLGRKSFVILDVSISPVKDDKGTITHAIIIHHDVTKREQLEEELKYFRFAIERATDAVYWLDQSGQITYVNDQACRALGYSRKELLHLYLWDIDPDYPPARWALTWEEDARAGQRLIYTQHRHKNGILIPVEISANHIKLEDREYHVAYARDITERKEAEDALRASEEKYRSVVDNIGTGIVLIGPDMKVLSVNNEIRARFPDADFTAQPLCYETFNCPPLQQPCTYCVALKTFEDGRVHETITETPARDGIRNYRIVSSPIKDNTGNVTAVVELAEDITEKIQFEKEKKKLERKLLQSQKMEAVGTLAGGIAHDFNNMLSVILGNAELLKAKLAAHPSLIEELEEIEKAALRSRDTTRQLLAFSRQQAIAPQPINLIDHIQNLEKTLARLIGENYELQVRSAPDLWSINFDPSQLDQILINLAVNARDAMPDGGRITIEAQNALYDEEYCQNHPEAQPGRYVQLMMSDNGHGMDPDTLAHAFDPFFSTKEVGKGTGLGLATVYGIIKQNNSLIDVYSEPGQGTTFRINIPKLITEEQSEEKGAATLVAPATGTILLVEDDDMVRDMTKRMLENIGYHVLVADNPTTALSLCQKNTEQINLLLTDVIMPTMNGAQLRDMICDIKPAIKVLFMSGYAASVISSHGVLDEGVHFIQKPFSKDKLAEKVYDALQDND